MSQKNANNRFRDVGGNVNIGDTYNADRISGFRKKILAALKNDTFVEQYFDELNVFLQKKTEETTVGLEAKLTKAGFGSLIERAKETKEKFVQILADSQYSIGYQRVIYAAIDEAISRFTYLIRPKIENGATKEDILKTLSEEVFTSLFDDLADIEEYSIDKACIEGLVYFITGNCYLKWEAK